MYYVCLALFTASLAALVRPFPPLVSRKRAGLLLGAAVLGGAIFNQPTPSASTPTAPSPAAASDTYVVAPDPKSPSTPSELDERRKSGLAKMSDELAQPKAKGTIEPWAIEPYTRRSYPETVAKFGKEIAAINEDRRKAAEIASIDPRCDAVTNVQVTTHSPIKNRRYWAECNNITRFYFDEKSLGQGAAVSVQTVAEMGRDGYRLVGGSALLLRVAASPKQACEPYPG